ncbi:hypothetical protein P3X46_028998 [Hevea brasiliensis]|uniref:Uncharacterized protein n=1 Tax=Hevea brasiliensis TaxID=3981 RepID=A0ABQ9KRQ5_HEVBR|nr:hypothetical protein P3X46_028998 [Hevea brasiliensis]
MSIDAKDIQILMWRTFKFSMNACCRFVQNHAFVSGVLLFLFVLYLFLPKVFHFLLYSSPFLACTAVFIQFYLHSQRSKTQNDVKDQAVSSIKSQPRTSDLVFSRDDKSSLQSQTLSHKNVKEKHKELESQTVVEEKNMVSSIPNDDSIGRAVLNEGKSREITENDPGKGVSRNVSIGENIAAVGEASKPNLSSLDGLGVQAAKCDDGGEAEAENSSSEEEDEEDKKGGRNKAVEWTEDDQKNLMDLGITELERNKRLESLIARRRERKSFKMQMEKILIDANSSSPIPVAPVLVANGNPFEVPNNPDEQIPGSAPSVLLPTRNPFDLPYDPLEEKPNLMADSFQQEFMAAHQKEMLFCRHESFTLGPFFPLEGKHNEYDIAGNSRLRRQQDKGNHDWLVDHLLPKNGETLRRALSVTDLVTEEAEAEEEESSNHAGNQPEEDGEADHCRMEMEGQRIENTHGMDSSLGIGSTIKMRTHTINQNKNESNSSSLSENNKRIIKPNKLEILPPVFRFPDVANTPSPNSAPCPIPKARTVNELDYEASPSTIDRSRLDNHLLYTNNGPWHTPTNSIASDMQLEVSEIGSPPLTGDESASSNDGDSLTYDGDVEKEITSGSEEMWGASPHAPKVQEHEMAYGEVNEVSRENITGGFSGFHKEPEDPITSSSRIEIPQEGHTHSINSDHKIFNDMEQVVKEVGEQRPSNALQGFSLEKSKGGTNSLREGYLQNPQASSNPPEKSVEELNISYDIDVPVHALDDLEGPKSVEDRNIGAEKSNISEVSDISKLDEEINSESSKQSERNYLNTPETSVKEVNVASSVDAPVVHMNSGATEKSIKQEVEFLSQPDKESNVESSKHIESKSSNSPGMPAEEVNIPYSVDDPEVLINVTKTDMKTSENRDKFEKYIEQEVLIDLSKRTKESTSEIVNYTENNSDRPPANQPIIEFLMPTTEDNNSNEGKDDSIPSRDGQKERSTPEVRVSGVNQSSNDPSTSGIQPEMTVQQASTVSTSSSSPKSVLPDRTPLDQTPSDLNQHMHADVSESGMEERRVRQKLLYEQVTEILALTAAQNADHVTDHPSTESTFKKSEETSITLKKSNDEARWMFNINKPVQGNGETKEDLKSTKSILDESETSISKEVAKELSKPPVENVPDFTVKEEALLQNSRSINDAVADDMVIKEKLELAAGESQRLGKKADTTEPSKAMEDTSSVCIKDTKAET